MVQVNNNYTAQPVYGVQVPDQPIGNDPGIQPLYGIVFPPPNPTPVPIEPPDDNKQILQIVLKALMQIIMALLGKDEPIVTPAGEPKNPEQVEPQKKEKKEAKEA